jgi:DNA mismatch repair protein MSH6
VVTTRRFPVQFLHRSTQGNLSVATTRLLKTILPGTCLWTSLRDVEGFGYDKTLDELKALYGTSGEETMDDDDYGLIPTAIRDMLGYTNAIEALGSMMWCVVLVTGSKAVTPSEVSRYLRQLNIDKDILTMKNFNVYDPMKRGQGLVLDGQSLAHIEVLLNSEGTEEGSLCGSLVVVSHHSVGFAAYLCPALPELLPSGKRLFRIWLCMPLREVSDINAR